MATMHIDTPFPARLKPTTGRPRNDRIPFWIAFGAAASVTLSIAVSQILLGAGLFSLLLSRKPLRFPPFLAPLGWFCLLTVAAVLASPDPWRGIVQVRKLYVFGIIPLVYSTFRSAAHVRGLVIAWALCSAASALVALAQAIVRWKDAIKFNAPLYDYVLDGRIIGLQSHWMTFGGVQMIALLLLLAYLLLGNPGRWRWLGWLCATLNWVVLVLGFTRSIFLAAVPAGAAVLLWASRRWVLPAAGVTLLTMVLLLAAPLRERVLSVLRPHEMDSNSRRVLMVRTGLRMIQAHPFLGLGPEQIEVQFNRYLPERTLLPLPKGWYGHLHNVYLQYAAERGIPALLCVLWMVGRIARDARQAIISTSAVWIPWGGLAVIAAILVEGLFEHNLGDSEVLTMFLTAVTCCYAGIRQDTAGHQCA